jgi:hypothetical protein
MPTYSEVQAKILANLAPDSQITAERHQEVENYLLLFAKEIAESQWLTGDLKMIDCTNQYIIDNFETTGPNLGKGKVGGEREGWAICNGYNDTRNRTGRVPVAYGNVTPIDSTNASQFASIGGSISAPITGGSKNAVIPSHYHSYTSLGSNILPNGTLDPTATGTKYVWNTTTATTGGYGQTVTKITGVQGMNTAGVQGSTPAVSNIDANMQPYIVTLFIQKL